MCVPTSSARNNFWLLVRRRQSRVIASPSGAFVSGGPKPADVWLSEDYVRSRRNRRGKEWTYLRRLLGPDAEAKAPRRTQILFLDAETRTWVDESGGMSVMFVTNDGRLFTPELSAQVLHDICHLPSADRRRGLGLGVRGTA